MAPNHTLALSIGAFDSEILRTRKDYARRNFIEMGAGTALATQVTGTEIPGNRWSAKGLKLGVSHQRPEMLTDDHLKYLKQMGVAF
jgi:hypothetical protein